MLVRFRPNRLTQTSLVLLHRHSQNIQLRIGVHQLREHLGHQFLVSKSGSINLGKVLGPGFNLEYFRNRIIIITHIFTPHIFLKEKGRKKPSAPDESSP